MDAQLARWRADTPAVTAGLVHLNNAGASLMPAPVLAVMQAHLRAESARGGYEAAADAAERIAAVYGDVARLLGVAGRNVALVENATAATALALSAFDPGPGDVLLTTHGDYVSNQLMYLSLARRRGVEVVRAEDAPEGGVDPESVRRILRRRRVKLVSVTWVPPNTGLVQPVEAVGAVCEEHGVPYLVDACQVVGQLPVVAAELRCDFLAGTARKFLRGPRGIGFLHVSERALAEGWAPLYPDLRGARWLPPDDFRLAEDARRFENWEFAYALVLGLGEAARYALEVGIGEAGARAGRLAAELRTRLAGVDGVRVLDRGRRLCAIVTLDVAGLEAGRVVRELRDWGINTAATARPWLPSEGPGERSAVVRISPHYYNSPRDVDIVVGAIEGLAAEA